MQTNIRTILVTMVLTFTFALTAQADKDTPISLNKLPDKALNILHKHFDGQKIALVKKEKDLFSHSYDVMFTNGDKIQFDSEGNWTEISCSRKHLPIKLLPAKITQYVKAHYQGVRVVEIDRERKGYQVDLSNGVELKFDKKCRLTSIGK